jgi:two-component system chemotaxis response regulator CheB
MIRVLVVDDSPTARTLIVEILSRDPEIQVVGEAQDGIEGVEQTLRLRPDLVTMDLRMPRLDGFAATKEIMITTPTPIVIVTASFKDREVEAAMQSLRVGAVAVLRKPPGPSSLAFEAEAEKLIDTVKAMAHVKVVRHWRTTPGAGPPRTLPRLSGRTRSIVTIATSTGGPAALHRILTHLPGDFAPPILVVQHNAPGFMGGLVNWLDGSSDLSVKVAVHDEALRPHTVYLAPDGQHLGVSTPGTALLSDTPPISGFRPAGTFLFDSAAGVYGSAVVAVILTGMGEDGVAGLRKVRDAGGFIIAQDEATSIVWGMPGAAVHAGLADLVLPIEEIPARLLDLFAKPST